MEKYQKVKTIHEWPLSRVDLVKIEGKNFILKNIHKDFKEEIERQRFLYNHLKNIKVPKIYDQWEENDRINFLMDYIKETGKISDKQALDTIHQLHKETENIEHDLFSNYRYQDFAKDLKIVKKYDSDISETHKHKVNGLFKQKQSMVHGDWSKKQIISSKDGIYIIDFGKSFFGPSILDYGYYAIRHENVDKFILGHENITPDLFNAAKFVTWVREINWYHVCKTKYIKNHDYKNEISRALNKLKTIFKI